MPKPLTSDPPAPPNERLAAAFALWQLSAVLALLAALIGLVLFLGSHRSSSEADVRTSGASTFNGPPTPTPISSRKVRASWYDVPADSLAARRAAPGEFTAAHNKLPLGTLIRVTHLKSQKSVLVRITDRGIHSRKIQLDLCKEAADQLGILRQGVARVRMDVFPKTPDSAPVDSAHAAP